MKTVAIVANGQINSPEILRPLILSHDSVVAVDGGLKHCHKMNITPNLIIGDFDSCPQEILQLYRSIPKLTLHTEKDETDLEVAIKGEEGKISLFGAWGNRIDHSIGNLILLTRWPGKVSIETETESIFAIDTSVKIKCYKDQILSLIPINGPVTGIYTRGLKWELRNATMDLNFIGISNVCLSNEVEISAKSGSLVCCLNKFMEESL